MIIDVNWTTRGSTEILSPECLVYEYDGEIFADYEGERVLIGKCRAMYLDVARTMAEGFSLQEVTDAHSSTLVNYYCNVFSEDVASTVFSEELNDLFDGNIFDLNLLILDRIELLSEYRGKGIGLSVVRYMMARFSQGAGIIALNAFPLQFEGGRRNTEDDKWYKNLQLDTLPKAKKKAQTKLVNLYRKLGFQVLPKSNLMVFNVADGIPPAPVTTSY